MNIKPYIIVCSETWNLLNVQYFTLSGYKLYYNNSQVNQNAGVVVYIKDDVTEVTEIIEIGRLKILNKQIKLSNSSNLEISSLYRCHDLSKLEFINNLKSYINSNYIS